MNLVYWLLVFFLFLLSLPAMAVISLLIFFDAGWPVIFFQKRIGRGGKSFILYKFRTMRLNAEKLQGRLTGLNEADGPVFKIRDDPRFTRFGRFLSHTGLDELPQLFNVLRGNMALIGPRPLPVYEVKRLKSWQQKRHVIKPGIISPWILEGYHRRSFSEWMKSDLAYAQQKSLVLDLVLILRTLKFLVSLLASELGFGNVLHSKVASLTKQPKRGTL